jgi:hypothetical protein
MKERIVEYKGRKQALYEWARELGMTYVTLRARLNRGWTVERAFTQSIQDHNIDVTGKTFGKWKVLRFAGIKCKAKYFLCECECGNRVEVRDSCLIHDKSSQCRVCCAITNGKKAIKHGLCPKHGRSKIWRTHQGIISRCHKPNSRGYEGYGGRGIYVCDEWRNSVVQFHKDMGDAPSAKHSIGRIDNDGPYAPWNCRWETAQQQGSNKRSPIKIWRSKVYDRDELCCRICGQKKRNMEAHHLNGWKAFPNERYDVNNGVTLCKECHKKFHRLYGKTNNTLKQFEDYSSSDS